MVAIFDVVIMSKKKKKKEQNLKVTDNFENHILFFQKILRYS